MKKIAVVFGYSSKCYFLAQQCVVSCNQSAKKQTDCKVTYYAYQFNWDIGEMSCHKHNPNIKLNNSIPKIDIIDIDGSKIDVKSYLPDIVVYDHFANHYLKEYDYVLFCHNDMLFHDTDMIKECIVIVDKPSFDIIAEPHIECSDIISARFYPNFIFVNAKKFIASNLSFCNDFNIFGDIRRREIKRDGGAELMASYFLKKNAQYQPYTLIPPTWFTHIRMGNDNGVETFNLIYPNSKQFHDIEKNCQQYIDRQLYGS